MIYRPHIVASRFRKPIITKNSLYGPSITLELKTSDIVRTLRIYTLRHGEVRFQYIFKENQSTPQLDVFFYHERKTTSIFNETIILPSCDTIIRL